MPGRNRIEQVQSPPLPTEEEKARLGREWLARRAAWAIGGAVAGALCRFIPLEVARAACEAAATAARAVFVGDVGP